MAAAETTRTSSCRGRPRGRRNRGRKRLPWPVPRRKASPLARSAAPGRCGCHGERRGRRIRAERRHPWGVPRHACHRMARGRKPLRSGNSPLGCFAPRVSRGGPKASPLARVAAKTVSLGWSRGAWTARMRRSLAAPPQARYRSRANRPNNASRTTEGGCGA